ncbi:MAG: PIG-L family deacetylase, partial [Proteobacteria bacterium]|nr:PIG-L family deacetylase [Pseudomonadota bacterium]
MTSAASYLLGDSANPTLFILAHQDDELGALELIRRKRAQGARCVFAYLTNGDWAGADPRRRNAESARVLSSFGVSSADLNFIGTDLGVSDGNLSKRLDDVWPALLRLLDVTGRPAAIVTLAYEGGHQDHDAANVLATILANRLGVLDACRQFPFYRAPLVGPAPFVVFRTLAANGPTEELSIAQADWLRYLSHSAHYPSQRKAMIGLAPLIAAHYAFGGGLRLQPLSLPRIADRPHSGALLYESRKRESFERFATRVQAFVRSFS